MKQWRKNLLPFCLLFFSFCASAQVENCEQVLIRANEEFNAGHFYTIPSILNDCLPKFTKEQKLRANLLLTQTYLLLDDPIAARSSYLEVLRANPEFVADENNLPTDVVYLSNKFTSAPVFAWFLKAGGNTSPIRVIYNLNTYGDPNVKEKYNLGFGYQTALGGDLYFREKFALRAELQYSATRYSLETLHYFQEDKKELTDRQNWISLPLSLMIRDNKGRYQPYGYVGYSQSYLLSDIVNINIVKVEADEDGNISHKSPDFNFKKRRNSFNRSVFAGAGIKFKLGLDFLFIDVRYGIGLKNVVSEKAVDGDYHENPTSDNFIKSLEPAIGYSHVDDYFRMDNVSISFGFLKPFYKARELRGRKNKNK